MTEKKLFLWTIINKDFFKFIVLKNNLKYYFSSHFYL